MSTLADKLNKLSPEQRALLEKKLRAKRQSAQNQSKIAPRADQSSFPLSAGQQRLWYLEQLDPNSSAYNITDAYHLTGPLDVAALTHALEFIRDRHDVLRARFETVDGKPMQQVEPIIDPLNYLSADGTLLQQIDLQDRPAASRLARAAELATESDNQPFDLATGPLWRVTLVKVGEKEHVLICTIHHIIADGWSLGLLTEELSEFYATLASGALVDADDLPIQYADFATWQSQWLADERAAKQLDHWSNTLAGTVEPLTLPTSERESTTSHTASTHGAQTQITIARPLIDAAQKLCQQNDISLFVFLLSAFEATLHRYTNQADMVVCTPIVARRQIELENLIGYFNNIVALRSALAPGTKFIDLLNQNNQVVLDAYEHQDLPFHHVTELPNLARVPLSRALIALADQDDSILSLPGITVETLQFSEDSADFDWSLFLTNSMDGLKCELVYKSGLFVPEIVNTFLHDYQQVIAQSVANATLSLEQFTVKGMGDFTRFAQDNSATPDSDLTLIEAKAIHAVMDEPLDEYEGELAAVWADVLGVEKVGRNQNFFELGGHSMLAVRLFLQIEQRITGSAVPLSLLLQAPTVAQMARALQDDGLEDGFSLVVPIEKGIEEVTGKEGAKPPLFFVHPAGGNVLYYIDLAKHLAKFGFPVYGIQSQGLDGKQPILETVEEMAQIYIEHIQRVQPQGPYLLSGYCLGGTIALDVAHRLTEQGHEVAFLGLLETYNWANMEDETLADTLQYQSQRVEYHLRNFLLLDAEGKQTFLKEKAKVARERSSIWSGSIKSIFGKTNDEDSVRTEDALLSKVWETNDIAAEAYVPTRYAGMITQFVPKQDYAAYDDPQVGWENIALGGVDVRRMEVYPAGMLIEPFVEELASEIALCVDYALSK